MIASAWVGNGCRFSSLSNHPSYAHPARNITAGGGPSVLDSSGARGFRTGIRLEW